MNKITQVQNGFIRGNQVIPVFDDQLLPVFGAIAVSSDILMKKMRIGNNPGIGGNDERVVGIHPLIIISNFDFILFQGILGTTWPVVPSRSFP